MERLSANYGKVQIVYNNFEISDLDFWRGEAYTAYFNHLDRHGGFYYEVSPHHGFQSIPAEMGPRTNIAGLRARSHDRCVTPRGHGPHPLLPRDRV